MFVALRECRLRFGTVIKILPVFIFVLPGLRPNDPGLKGTDRKGLAQHRYKTLLHVRQSFVERRGSMSPPSGLQRLGFSINP